MAMTANNMLRVPNAKIVQTDAMVVVFFMCMSGKPM